MARIRSLNRVFLIGNLTRNPVLKKTNSGVSVCTFGIATNTTWKSKDGSIQERTEYHNLIAFNKLAEICAKVLSVGMLIWAEGEIRSRVLTDESGKKVYRVEIKLNDITVLDNKKSKKLEKVIANSDTANTSVENLSSEDISLEEETETSF
ncbi:MAG: single-stranded DNA-binding protein [Candidatus Dojkabacteria bacterium]|nr:single-stranded DNA-binding protein [Candidatus Dojkabacteria bacterium]